MESDITIPELAKTRDELRELGVKYHNLLETITIGVFSLGPAPDFPLMSANRKLLQMLGYDCADQLTGRSMRDLFSHLHDWDRFYGNLVTHGEVSGTEVLLKHRNGLDIFVAMNGRAHRSPDTVVVQVEGFAEDVTEHKVLEAEMLYHESELNRYASALTHANNKLNLLSNITRHDILNQLNAFGMFLDMMKLHISDEKILGYIAKEEKISETIRTQILFTRDYQDIGVVSPRWYDVKKTILSATSPLPLSPDSLAIDFDNLYIFADPLLEKVFYNLVENGIRHGEGLTRITFSSTPPDKDGITLICENDGVGIPLQYKEAIFNRQHFKHTGFGLFLSREILAISGLSICETGEPVKGVRFEIAVPNGSFRIDT
jgi:PAS domain S-box-containing protein